MATFPDWYDPTKTKITDAERLIKNYFQDFLPDTNVVSWLPSGDDILASLTTDPPQRWLRVFRIGGPMGYEDGKSWNDKPRIQFAAIAPTRDESWDIITFVRIVLWQFHLHPGRMTAGGTYAMVETVGEVEGPALTPVQFRDERLVPVTLDLDFTGKKGLPDYRIPLGL